MTLLNPLMLLTLFLIPLLIIIYLLFNRYKKQTIASTYIFEVSNRFLKRKKKLNRFHYLLNLILQIVVIFVLSITLAHPIFFTKDHSENMCFILDASGSMNIEYENSTRFDSAKDKIKELVKHSKGGSTYSIIYATQNSYFVLKNEEEKENVYYALNDLKAEYTYSNLDSALSLADKLYQDGLASKLYLLTDKVCDNVEGVELISYANDAINYATYDLKRRTSLESYILNAKAISYKGDANLNIKLYLDNKEQDSIQVEVEENIETSYSFEIPKTIAYENAKVIIENEDDFSLDNEITLYKTSKSFEALLVSDAPLFIKSMIEVYSYSVDVVSPSEFVLNNDYCLYIFDSFVPETIPTHSSTWFINPPSSLDNTGFIVQENRNAEASINVSYARDNTELYNKLIKDVHYNNIILSKYKKCSLFSEFTPILNYGSDPILFVNNSTYGNKQVIFSFDLHDSDLPLLYDYAVLMRNLLDYTMPTFAKTSFFKVGDQIDISVLPSYSSLSVTTPTLEKRFLSLNNHTVLYTLNDVGTYIFSIVANNRIIECKIYSSFDKEEIIDTKANVVLNTNVEIKTKQAMFDNLSIFVVVVGLFLLMEWVVYTREQY